MGKTAMLNYTKIPEDCRDSYLTIREKELIELLATGLEPKEIAKQLGLKRKTVANELSLCASKHMKCSRYVLVYKAYKMGLVT